MLSKMEYTKTELENEMRSKNLSLNEVLYYNKNLSAEFCVKYLVFNDECATSVEDTYICYSMVLSHQRHLKMEDLIEADEKLDEMVEDPNTGISCDRRNYNISTPLHHTD